MNKHEKEFVERAALVGIIAEKGMCCANLTGWILSDANTNTVISGGSPIAYCLSFTEAMQIVEYFEKQADNSPEE